MLLEHRHCQIVMQCIIQTTLYEFSRRRRRRRRRRIQSTRYPQCLLLPGAGTLFHLEVELEKVEANPGPGGEGRRSTLVEGHHNV